MKSKAVEALDFALWERQCFDIPTPTLVDYEEGPMEEHECDQCGSYGAELFGFKRGDIPYTMWLCPDCAARSGRRAV